MSDAKRIKADYVDYLCAEQEHARESYYNKDAELARAEGYIDILKTKLAKIRRIVRDRYMDLPDKDASIETAWQRLDRIEKVLRWRPKRGQSVKRLDGLDRNREHGKRPVRPAVVA